MVRVDVSWFVLCARALGFAACYRRDARMNENKSLCFFLYARALGFAACYRRDARK